VPARCGVAAAALLAAAVALAPQVAAQDPGPPAPAPAPVSPPADAIAEVRRLCTEGKDLFRTAGDTDLPQEDRRKARQEAYARLSRAKEMLDAWTEKHPEDERSLADLDTEISVTMFFLRKEGGVGEFRGGLPGPAPGPGAGAAGGSNPPTGGGAPAPAAPPPRPPTAAEQLDRIREYEKDHPGDVPGLHERYSRFLAEFPDRAAPEYAEAVKRVDELGQRLKDVYRKARDDDPDSLVESDPAQVAKLVDQLAEDLHCAEPAVRLRAARYLGGLGSGKAAPTLVDSMMAEKDPDVLDAVKESLARIGGRRVCERLAKEKVGSAASDSVVDVLARMVLKGGVNARIAGETLAVYARGLDATTQGRIAQVLFDAGKDGAVGLSLALDFAPAERRVEYTESLARIADPRTAGNLARLLTVNPQGSRRAQHQAARKAIEAIGKPGVRWLIPALDDPACQVWTAEMLRQITGAKPKDDKRKTWEKWFRENRKAIEGR
jgi:hypothetical protein